MTGFSPTSGFWANDPTRRHRLRYRDGRWTGWVADDGSPTYDPDGLRRISRRRRLGVVGVVLALWAVASFVGVLAASLNTDTSTDSIMTAQDWADVRAQRAAITAEFDAWVLPPSIAADAVLDRSAADDPIPYETRTYVPANGASADQAVADLQQMLLTRGWMYPYDEKHPWSARKAGLYATMQITIEAGKIVVRIDG